MTMAAERMRGSGYLLLLPERADADLHWWRIDSARGAVIGPNAVARLPLEVAGAPVVVLVPAALAPVRELPLPPGLSCAQALASARLEAPVIGDGPLHGAVAATDGDRLLVAHPGMNDMEHWLAACAGLGIDPAALVPAALVLPRPDAGLVVARLGDQCIARSLDAAFVGEPALVETLGQMLPPTPIVDRELEHALLATFLTPPLDLRQGSFAPRRAALLSGLDWPPLARMTGLCLLLGLAVMLASIGRWNRAAGDAEAAVVAEAQRHGIRATDLASAEELVREAQTRRGTGAAGFAAPLAAVLLAIRATPSSTLRDLAWTGDGTLHLTIAAPRVEDVNGLLIALQRDGWAVTVPPAPVPDATGAIVAAITVRAP
ncbi:type II secretion system protein GspL [Novosphingobium sp. FKTRR1]|uniref:type II secretion system protein GspL n=1 Tax=Novosphingobium sp. FKTRR1 TaxID=2879118 RepID=UPI001CF0AD3C|nr:type II secretion system protein GspL [Novosphingobium sp. FKTRR1]